MKESNALHAATDNMASATVHAGWISVGIVAGPAVLAMIIVWIKGKLGI